MSGRRTIGNTFTVTTMDDPVSVVAQYSPDKSTIHTTFQAGDLYMRTRSTDSSTWSNWQKIVGESGGETDFSFGISSQLTTTTVTTSPSDITSWSDAPIAVTSAKPYLWAKVQKKVWNETTQSYDVASTTYIRMTGESGVSVQAQYAPNSSPSSSEIHTTWQSGDLYMRTKSSDSDTWSSWHKIVGESGDETNYSFGISSQKTTTSTSTPPSDITTWSDAPLAVTSAKPYLWSKVVKKVWNETTQTYDTESTTYVRLTGEDGTFYSIETSIESVTIDADTTSKTLNVTPTATFYKSIGSVKSTESLYWALYWKSGTSYTRHSYGGKSTNISLPTSYSTSYDAIVIVVGDSQYPTTTSYLAKKEVKIVKNGDNGTSPIIGDLSNEMDSVGCDKDGVVTTDQYIETTARIWVGSTPQTLTSIVCKIDDTEIGTSYAESGIGYYYKATKTLSTGVVKVYVRQGATITTRKEVTLVISDGTNTFNMTLTINGARQGVDGSPSVVYRLVPSVSEIIKKKDGTYVPSGNITCSVTKNSGGTQSTPSSSEYTLKMKVNGGSEVAYAATAASTITSNIVFILYVNSVEVDRESIPLVTDGTDGTSPIFCDLTNEISSVACNSSGVTTSEQSVATYAKMWLGSTPQTITSISCKVDGYTLYSSYQSDSSKPNYYYKYSATESTGYIIIYVRGGTTITSKTEVTITLTATINGTSQSQDIVLTINGVKAGGDGIDGNDAVIYQLVPTYNEVVLKKDGTYAPTSGTYMTCSVSKNVGGTTSTPSSSEYTLKYILNGGSETTYSSTAVTAGSITSNLIFVLYVNNVEVDRETIPLVSDGNKGDDGENYFIQTTIESVTIQSDYTSTTFNATAYFYIKTGAEAATLANAYYAYYLRSGTTYTLKGSGGKNTSCTASNISATTSYDGLVFYIFSTSYTGTSPEGQTYLAKKEIKFVKNGDNGENGDDGISYTFVFTEAYAKADANGLITGNIKGYAYKYEGGVRSALTSTTIRYGYILNDSDTYATATTNSSGFFDASSWFTGDYIDDFAKNSPSIFAAIIIDSTVVHVEYITISRQGDTGGRGKVGRFYYYVGDFSTSDTTSYAVTNTEAPYFSYNGNYWIFNPESNGTYTPAQMGTPSSSSSNWQIMYSEFKYIITQAIFGDYAHFGSAIINGDWMLSTNGKLCGDEVTASTTISGGVAGGTTFSVKPYTLFNSSYPLGDCTTVASVSDTVYTLSNGSTSANIGGQVWLSSASTYRISCTGYHTNSNMYIRIYNSSYGSCQPLYINSTSYVTRTAYFRVTTSGYYYIQMYQTSTGYSGYVNAMTLLNVHYAPYYAVDLKTGVSYQTQIYASGGLRSPFTYMTSGGSFSSNFNDNVAVYSGDTTYYSLPWTSAQSGRKVVITNYYWNGNYSTASGNATFIAPTDKYFFEDGITKSELKLSREGVELIGYGDSSTFYGWIVLKRFDLGTSNRYGHAMKTLAYGRVTGSSSGASISYRSFDNSTLSVTRIAPGRYTITFGNSSWFSDAGHVFAMATGYGYCEGASSSAIKATITAQTTTSITIDTSDDDTNNDGSFNFFIMNFNDWYYL